LLFISYHKLYPICNRPIIQKQRRTFERIPVYITIRSFCEKSPYMAIIINCTKNGIGINTFSNWLPCSYKVELLIPLDKEILSLQGKISRINKITDYSYNIGIELVNPPHKYLAFIDSLEKIRNSTDTLYSGTMIYLNG